MSKNKNKFHYSFIKKISLKLLLAFFVCLFVLGSDHVFASESVSHTIELEKFGSISYSQIYQEEKEFNAVMIKSNSGIDGLMVNFFPFKNGVWEPVEIHDDGFGAEAFIFTAPTKTAQFKIIERHSGDIKLDADFLFTSNKSIGGSGELYAGPASSSGLKIISRSEWGADENYRYWTPELKEKYESKNGEEKDYADPCGNFSKEYATETKLSHVLKYSNDGDELLWPLSYASSLKKIVVHHTDSDVRDITGDKVMDGRDYEAMVRAIYHFHAKTRGWGDVGYNYLIDPMGNIYEGRYGGDKVVGAHALCYNNGSMGIGLIGNYENDVVPQPALNSLIKLIADKSKTHNIDPEGSSVFRGKVYPNVAGHKDYRKTACPGKNLYNLLARIRERAGLVYRLGNLSESGLTQTFDYDAELKGDLSTIELPPNGIKKVYIQFKNTGKKSWDNNTWLHVVNSSKQKGARVVSIVSDKSFVAADMKEDVVAPGEIATFEVEMRGGYISENNYFEVTPVANGKYKVSRSSTFIPIYVKKPVFSYEVVSSDLPSGIVFQDQKISASIKLKNTGNATWTNFGSYPIRMGTENLRDRRSFLLTKHATRLAHLLESEVSPGSVGTFLFDLEAPSRYEGVIKEYFSPVVEHVSWLENKGLNFEITIKKPKHAAQIENNIRTISMQPGEMKEIKFDMKNVGDLAWEKDDMNITFINKGVKIFKNRITPSSNINPGGIFKFDFWTQAPYEEGKYLVFLNSKFNRSPIENGAARLTIDVPNPFLRAKMTKRTPFLVDAARSQEKEIEVKFLNLGNAVWRNSGKNAIHLAPTRPSDHISKLYYSGDWVNKYRAARMSEREVKPGEIGTFTFKVKPFELGTFTEYFQLVMENVGWIDGTFIRWDFKVSDCGSSCLSVPVQTSDSSSGSSSSVKKTTTTIPVTVPVIAPIPIITTITNPAIITKASSAKTEDFRVRISYDDDVSKITADKNYKVVDKDGKELFKIDAGYYFTARRVNNNIHVQFFNVSKASDVVRVIPDTGGIVEVMTMQRRPTWNNELNDNRFRGIMEIRSVNNKTAYINELPLEDYMKGLAEVSNSALTEKQKAIAILARTYAKFYMDSANRKFPGLPYDGSDDPAIFQKYLGYGVEKRSPNFVSAVNATKDKVVTYNGKIVKTPYFNQSSGKTLSAKEVWGWTHTPYLQSVDDPYCKGMTKSGHGVGMSGCGSEGMAKDGKTYEEIIKYYYKGVEISNRGSN